MNYVGCKLCKKIPRYLLGNMNVLADELTKNPFLYDAKGLTNVSLGSISMITIFFLN